MEQLVNLAQTTLNGSINASVTSVVVTSASAFPTSGTFSIVVGTELMTVTAVSGTTFTVTRGAESTAAASHSSGDTVTHVLTKRVLDALFSEHGLPTQFSAPAGASFSWVNQGGAAYSGSLLLTAPASAGQNLRCLVKTQPSTPYTVTVYFQPFIIADNNHAGILLRESATGKIETFGIQHSTSVLLAVFKFTSATVFSANRATVNVADLGGFPVWLRIANDGATITYSFSIDGVNFRTLATAAVNNFFTTAPDQVGLFAESNNASNDAAAYIPHYKET